ncbi:hypothetical protein ACLB2K_005012 [Fragaria x ananassa]
MNPTTHNWDHKFDVGNTTRWLYYVDAPFPEADGKSKFNVMDYGAIANGQFDNTQAFLKAWEEVCGSTQDIPTLIIPKDNTFLLSSVEFKGPCKAASVNFQLNGNIVAPNDTNGWGDKGRWVQFDQVQGLIINGGGQIDGQGQVCIGSLGEDGSYSTVEDVQVRNCTFKGTQNGARIKTWQAGSGYAKNIIFEHITIQEAKNPIIIDQKYSDHSTAGFGTLGDQGSALQVSDVTFRDFHGSVAGDSHYFGLRRSYWLREHCNGSHRLNFLCSWQEGCCRMQERPWIFYFIIS